MRKANRGSFNTSLRSSTGVSNESWMMESAWSPRTKREGQEAAREKRLQAERARDQSIRHATQAAEEAGVERQRQHEASMRQMLREADEQARQEGFEDHKQKAEVARCTASLQEREKVWQSECFIQVVHDHDQIVEIGLPQDSCVAEALVLSCQALKAPLGQHTLSFAGDVLALNDTLASHGMESGAVLHLVEKPCDIPTLIKVLQQRFKSFRDMQRLKRNDSMVQGIDAGQKYKLAVNKSKSPLCACVIS